MDHVTLTIYDVLGRVLTKLIDSELSVRSYKTKWDGTNNSGIQISTGIYFYVLKTDNNNIERKKMILLSI